jgi:cyclic-di-GMP phosphodiesterase TipF (flagellum assembly factor)
MRRLQEETEVDDAPLPDLVAVEVETADIELVAEEQESEVVVVMTEEVTLDLMEEEPSIADLALEEAESLDLMAEEREDPDLGAEEPTAPDIVPEEPASLDIGLEEPAPFDLTVEKAAPFERSMGRAASFDLSEEEPPFDPDLLPVLRKAIEANRIDLYLQPIVTLPERTLRYGDAIARVRTDAGELLGADRYRRVAELAGLLPRIDNVMLVKSVQLLRRLGPDAKLKRVFCALSAPSLLDPDFFPELVEFLEENSALGESLTFQLSQRAIGDLGEGELTSLKTLGKLGFCFSLDRIAHLDLDFGALRDYFFRFVKIDAETFLNGMQKARAPVPAADMARYLDRFDLKLIVAKVGDEASVDRLLDYGVELAEGDLFAEPKPVSAEMFRELEDASAS